MYVRPSLSLLPAKLLYLYYTLLTLGYSEQQAIRVVKQKYSLTPIQEKILKRCIHSYTVNRTVAARRIPPKQIKGKRLCIDGYNQALTMISLEKYGYVYRCTDGLHRDELLGAYKTNILMISKAIIKLYVLALRLGVDDVLVILDSKVSKSGELASMLRKIGIKSITAAHADKTLIDCSLRNGVVASSDVVVLKRTPRHIDLIALALTESYRKNRRFQVIDVKSLIGSVHEDWCKEYNPLR